MTGGSSWASGSLSLPLPLCPYLRAPTPTPAPAPSPPPLYPHTLTLPLPIHPCPCRGPRGLRARVNPHPRTLTLTSHTHTLAPSHPRTLTLTLALTHTHTLTSTHTLTLHFHPHPHPHLHPSPPPSPTPTPTPSPRYLKDCEPEFLEELSHYTTREAFAQGELIPNVSPDGVIRLCILVTGSAARGGAILTSGANWGDLILSSAVLRDTREARALTYCEIISLRRVGLEDLFALYPTSHKIVRECSLKLATQRAMIAIAMYKRANTDAEAGAIASALTSIAEGEGDALEGAPGEAMMAASSPAAADSHNTPPGAKPSPRSLKSIAAKAEGRPTEGVPTPDGALRTPVNKPRLPIGKGKATPASPMAAMSPSQVLHQMNMDRVLSVGAWRVVPEGYLPSPAPGPKEAVTTYTPLPSTVLGSSSLLGGVARTLAGESAAVSSSTRNTPSNRTSRTQRSQRDSHRPGVESGRIGNGSYRRRNSDAVRGGGAEGGGAEGVTPTVMDKLDRLERSVELLLAHAAEEKQRRQDPYGGNPFAA